MRYRKLKSLSSHNFAAVLPGDSVAGLVVANGVSNFLNLYNTLLVCRLVLTWFPNSPPAIVGPLRYSRLIIRLCSCISQHNIIVVMSDYPVTEIINYVCGCGAAQYVTLT